MADAINSSVDLIHPTESGVGVITSDQVWVVFDREIDESTVEGNFFITGPDQDTWSGPDLQIYQEAASIGGEGEILQSPTYAGIVQGDITFARLALDSTTVISGLDTVGSGHIYRSKVIFSPTNPLGTDTTYTVYLAGDEDPSDTYSTGIAERTVFDVTTSGDNVTTGTVEFDGGYIGTTPTDLYHVEITTAGLVGTAKFQFYRDSDQSSVFGPFKTKQGGVLLSDGVSVSFSDATYSVGDAWYTVVKAKTTFSGTLIWPFDTGSGSILTIPTTASTSVIGDTVTTTSTSTSSTSSFSVSSTDPADAESNWAISSSDQITITFDADIDVATVVSGVDVSVFTESVSGDPSVTASGQLQVGPSVSGAVLTLDLTNQLAVNNLVTVTLDSSIANTSGITLGSNYEFEFTTTYSPMYCAARRLRLEIGAYIADVPDDTLNLAIYIASLESESMTWNTDNNDDTYYKFVRSQWTCCRAQEILLLNTIGASGSLKSKKLGDLSVEYDTSKGGATIPLQRAVECQNKWEVSLQAGARTVQTPQMVVKGEHDIDRPPMGRGWLHSRGPSSGSTPVANNRTRLWSSRRFRNIYSRNKDPKGWWNK